MAGIATFLDPALLPARTQEQQPFDDAMAYVMQNFPKWGGEVNATLAAISTLAAGGVYAIPFKFSTATADGDPSPGFLRVDNATQNAATTIRLDLVGMDTVDYTGLIDTFDASTSSIKGQIRIAKMADPSKFIDFNVTARAAPAGYRNISVTVLVASSANPFANNDPVMLFFQRTGDKGDIGPTGYLVPTLVVREEYGAGVQGPTILSGKTYRALNTVRTNSIIGASLANGQVTLPAGTYDFEGSAVLLIGGYAHKTLLWNLTDNAVIEYGMDQYTGANSYNDGGVSTVRGRFAIAATKVVQLATFSNIATTAGGGIGSGTYATVCSELILKKAA
jgi:hypothetical protein